MKKFKGWALIITILLFSIPVTTFAVASSKPRALKVLSLGDSITAGMDDGNGWVGNVNSYLDTLLKKNGKDWDFLGNYSRDNITRYQADGGFCLASVKYNCVVAVRKPGSILQLYIDYHKKNTGRIDLFILQGGVNDLNSLTKSPAMPKPINSMKLLINSVRKDYPNATILLQGIARPKLDNYEKEFNSELAKLKIKNVYYIDTSSVNKEQYFIDGLHPNASGYKAMAKIFYDKVKKLGIVN